MNKLNKVLLSFFTLMLLIGCMSMTVFGKSHISTLAYVGDNNSDVNVKMTCEDGESRRLKILVYYYDVNGKELSSHNKIYGTCKEIEGEFKDVPDDWARAEIEFRVGGDTIKERVLNRNSREHDEVVVLAYTSNYDKNLEVKMTCQDGESRSLKVKTDFIDENGKVIDSPELYAAPSKEPCVAFYNIDKKWSKIVVRYYVDGEYFDSQTLRK